MSHVSHPKEINQASLELEEYILLMVPSHGDKAPAQHRGTHHPGYTKKQQLQNDLNIAILQTKE